MIMNQLKLNLSGGRGSTETLNKHHIPYTELLDYSFSLNLFSFVTVTLLPGPTLCLANHELALAG